MSFFERTLSLWVGLCIVIGIGLGHLNKSRPWYERGRQPRRARPVENQRRG